MVYDTFSIINPPTKITLVGPKTWFKWNQFFEVVLQMQLVEYFPNGVLQISVLVCEVLEIYNPESIQENSVVATNYLVFLFFRGIS